MRTVVDSAIQNRRRYFDVDESEIAPKDAPYGEYHIGNENKEKVMLTDDWLSDQA